MKRKVKTQPTNPFYTSEPAVSRKLMASQTMVPSASLAGTTNKVVPKHPGKLSGVAGFTSKTRPTAKAQHFNTPKVGATASQPAKMTVKKPSKSKV